MRTLEVVNPFYLKVIGIVVLGLLWCNFANANLLEFEK